MLRIVQDWPLLLHRVIDHAAAHHPRAEVVTRSVEGPTHRTTYPEVRARALSVARRLRRDGIRQGDRVGTLAWSTWRHLEAWFGVTGAGAVVHTVNPRLPPAQIAWICNHAEDRILLADLTFVPLLERLAPRLPTVERFVLLTGPEHMPETPLRGAICYEDWIAEGDGDAAWTVLDERAASGLRYASGADGEPRGVLASHRSTVLQAMAAAQPGVLDLSAEDRVLPVAPMFHADAWGLPIVAAMTGAATVLPGPRLDAPSVHALMEEERVTFAAAPPEVWATVRRHLEAAGGRISTCRRAMIGGVAVRRTEAEMRQERLGGDLLHCWDAAEAAPLGLAHLLAPEVAALDAEGRLEPRVGRIAAPFTTELKIADGDGRALPWDGVSAGRLSVRGPSVARGFFGAEDAPLDAEGFCGTGDAATIDPTGALRLLAPEEGPTGPVGLHGPGTAARAPEADRLRAAEAVTAPIAVAHPGPDAPAAPPVAGPRTPGHAPL